MADLCDIFAQAGGRDARSELEIDPAAREEVRSSVPLARAYRDHVEAHRRRLHETKGKPSKSTLQKERQAIRRWEAWDREQRPEQLPDDVPFDGLPIGYVQAEYVERFVTDAAKAGTLSRATIESTWNHLRVVWNWLVAKSKVIDAAPDPDVSGTLDRVVQDEPAELTHATWSVDDLGTIYQALAASDLEADFREQLLAAFVVSTCCGPRTNDLFGLRWGDDVHHGIDEPHLTYRAKKTGKRHWCPLPPCVVAHLDRLSVRTEITDGTLVFPHLASEGRTSRRRNRALKDALKAIDAERYRVDDPRCDYAKPWQVGRATAYTRADAVVHGAGRYLCHPPHSPKRKQSADVRDNYLDWQPQLRKAILGMSQPPEFEADPREDLRC